VNDKIIGIIGGMGPEATADLYLKIIKNTKAKKDQDHFRVIIDSNVKIPDRTQAILHNGEDPTPYLIETAKNLEKLSVDVACIPCITAHYFYDLVQESVNFKIINIIEEVVEYIKRNYPNIKKVGVLSTTGTIETKLFNQYLEDYSIVYPTKEIQERNVMEAIYGEKGIKSGGKPEYARRLLVEAGNKVIERGAEVIIAGCTEIGLVLDKGSFDVETLDLLEIASTILIHDSFDY
jgi:aspartate racemase